MMRWFKWMAMTAALLVLAGCSSLRIIDSDVTAFPAWNAAPPVPGTTYRFERLPSQQHLQQDKLETLAQASLARVGMVLEPQIARYSVQILFNIQYLERFPDAGWIPGSPGVFIGDQLGSGYGFGYPIRFGEPYYKRDLTILMRDLSTSKIAFETRAHHEDIWDDTLTILPAMLDSALLGFPQPPLGTRRIQVNIQQR